MADKLEKIVSEIEKLSVLELSELVNALQERLGVSAAPVAAPAPADSASVATPAEGAATAGQGVQTVVLTGAGANKIAVIKALREINQQLGLKEAKDMTEKLPAEILKEVKADQAQEAKKKLEAAGATVELK